jgi:polyferredoxin
MSFFKSKINQKCIKIFFFSAFVVLLIFSDLWAVRQGGGRRALSFTQYLLYPRVWLSVLFGITGGLLLMSVKITSRPRALLLAVVFVVFAILPVFDEITFFAGLSPHPSPMCALTKPVIFSLQMKQFIFPAVFAGVLAFIAFLSIIGNKLFCGWACPIGALQELFHLIPLPLKKIKPPFAALNIFRAVLLIAFVPVLLFWGTSLYGYFNPFELLHWPLGTDFWTIYAWAVVAIMISASLFIYRPFCYSICPIGILTWLLEQISLIKIRFNKDKCNRCNICVKKSPCLAMESILAEERIRPDCYACGKCIEVCPTGALKFRTKEI